MTVSEYLKIVEEQIRQKAIAPELIDELRQHIETQAEAYEEDGMTEDAALLKAVEDMGDPVDTGVQLDIVHQPKMDKRLFLLIAAGFLFSAVIVFINQKNGVESGDIMWTGLAICCVLSISFSPYRGGYDKHPFQMWCLYLILAITFYLLSFDTRTIQSLLNSSLMGFAVISYHYRNGGKSEYYSLLVCCGITCMLTCAIQTFSYTYLILVAHVFIITLGICRNWYNIPRNKHLIILWSIPVLLIPALLTSISLDGHQQDRDINMRSSLSNLNLFDGYSDKMRFFVFAILCLLQLSIFLCMYANIRKLTNQLCRIICTGVLTAFLVTYFQSFLCLLGYGPADQMYFPFFSLAGDTIDAGPCVYVQLSAIFLHLQRQDKVIPRKRVAKKTDTT